MGGQRRLFACLLAFLVRYACLEPYTLRRVRRARNIRITVHDDGRVLVTAPVYVAKKRILAFLEEQKPWIDKKLALAHAKPKSDLTDYSRAHYLANKREALALTTRKLAYWNAYYHFEFKRVSVKSMRTRWGSCTAEGNLNFNYKILFLPEEVQNYLIVHELCHLKEMNHSLRFWALVAGALPNYQELRKRLRVHG